MENKNRLLAILFAAVAAISFSGFYHSYFALFPNLGRFYFVTHIHLFLFVCWFALVIAQPILIRKRKMVLHRRLGRISYFLAPLLVISIFVLVWNSVPKNYALSPEQAGIIAIGGVLDAILFSVCYVIAMVKKKNLRWHVAFIIGATLVVLNPGLGRLIGYYAGEFGILAMVVTPYLVSLSIVIYEKVKLKRPMLKNPYLLFALFWTCELALFIIVPQTDFWKELLQNVVAIQS
ncbi:MAG: hypothetical protein EOO50_09540 [Flavobacterium sp.]|uniref:hypothetical protein n=1 Tax=Flavobacterium sp. TaxID=239 RepID=UPI001216952F|nr:hypothetical protein [Flavobacterium sp.]RZJ66459.1 MAG: hypothetical protein EOO50_09540 [Flavobacterium sp.]